MLDKRPMLAVMTSCFSNHRWARLYFRQDMSSFLDAHVEYFNYVGGVSGQVVYDNMRTVVRKFTTQSKDKEPTLELLKLSCYYQFDYRFCNARRGNEKGHVERSVEYVRQKAFAPKDEFDSLQAANEYLIQICERLNQKPLSEKTQPIQSLFEQELRHMKTVPPSYDAAQLNRLRVDKYSCIKVDTNWYSVPEGHVGGMLDVKIFPEQILVYSPQNQCIATHQRAHSRFEHYLNLDHYLKTLYTKPGALAGSLSLRQADKGLRHIFYSYFEKRPKMFVELLLYLRKEQYNVVQLQQAIDSCIKFCPHQQPSLDKIKILLQTAQQPQPSELPLTDELSLNILKSCSEQLQAIQSLIG